MSSSSSSLFCNVLVISSFKIKCPSSILYSLKLSLYVFTILFPATRNPDTRPIVSVINKNITRYFPNSSLSSLGSLFLSGFFIFNLYFPFTIQAARPEFYFHYHILFLFFHHADELLYPPYFLSHHCELL